MVRPSIGIPVTVCDRAMPVDPPQSWLPPGVVPTLSQYWDTPVPADHENVTVDDVSVLPGVGLVICAIEEEGVGVGVGVGIGPLPVAYVA